MMAVTSKAVYLLLICLFSGSCSAASGEDDLSQPQQIHLSLGHTPMEIVVTWTTYNFTDEASLVQYGETDLSSSASGSSVIFTDGGSKQRRHNIHRVRLTDLKPFTTYRYRCGSSVAWSAVYTFSTLSDRTDWSPRMLVYGDLGWENGQSIPRIREEVDKGNVDLIFHAGDFAYDLDSNDSYTGDAFMRTLEPIAARVPYMTCVGNHEARYNFSNYVNRFSMYDMTLPAASPNNHFYAFHLGPALIISISTEFYYFVQFGFAPILTQYKWLESVLKAANRPEARAKHPWIITFGHRPMYCTDDDGDDCTHHNSIIRKGIPLFHTLGLEDLFQQHGVDVNFWAHEHSYERLWPVYDFQVMNGSTRQPYFNPPAPVHIITGSAGCREKLDHFGPKKPWSAFRLSDYGYTRLHILNATHLTIEQISDDQQGKVVDAITVIQEKHGPRQWPTAPSTASGAQGLKAPFKE